MADETLTAHLQGVADAIRDRGGGVDKFKPATFADKIRAIPYTDYTKPLKATDVYNDMRPVDWIQIPKPSENEVYFLVLLPTLSGSRATFSMDVSATADFNFDYGTVTEGVFEKKGGEVVTSTGAKVRCCIEFGADFTDDFTTQITAEDGYTLCKSSEDEGSADYYQILLKFSMVEVADGNYFRYFWNALPKSMTSANADEYYSDSINQSYHSNDVYEIMANLPKATQFSTAVRSSEVSDGDSSSYSGMRNLMFFTMVGENNFDQMNYMFYYCYNLICVRGLNYSHGVTFRYMFYYCYNLLSISDDMEIHFDGITLEDPLNKSTGNNGCFYYMFYYCYCLKAVPALYGENVLSAAGMFYYCSGLHQAPEIHFPKCWNLQYMFYNCSTLLSAPNYEFLELTQNSVNCSYMFYGCYCLTDFNGIKFSYPDNDPVSNNCSYMFQNCYSLRNVSDFTLDFGKPVSTNYMFYMCRSLLETPKFEDLSACGGAVRMFYGCLSLVKTEPYTFDIASTIEGLYYGCEAIHTISKISAPKATDAESLFYNCYNLTVTPDIDAPLVTDVRNMFYGCRNLKKVTYAPTAKIQYMGSLFCGCYQLSDISSLASWDVSNVTDFSGMFQDCYCLKDVSALSGWSLNSNVKTISHMFDNCKQLATEQFAALTNFWALKNLEDVSYLFRYCYKLTSVSFLKNFNTSKINNFSYMFYYCNALTSFDIGITSNVSTSSSTTIWQLHRDASTSTGFIDLSHMFESCTLLSTVTPLKYLCYDSVSSFSSMFDSCSNLTSVDLGSNQTIQSATKLSYMFRGCSKLQSVTLPTVAATCPVTDLSYMFDNCKVLTSVSGLTNDFTKYVTTIAYMFSDCTKFSSNSFMGNWTCPSLTSISSLFENCTALSTSSIGYLSKFNVSGVTNFYRAFYNCTGVGSFTSINSWTVNQKYKDSSTFEKTSGTRPSWGTSW